MVENLQKDNIKLILYLSTFLILNFIAFQFYFGTTPFNFEVFDIKQLTVVTLFMTMCTVLCGVILRSVLLVRSWIGIPLLYDSHLKSAIFCFTPIKITIFLGAIIFYSSDSKVINFLFFFFLMFEMILIFKNSASALQDLYTGKEKNIEHWIKEYITEKQKKKMFAVHQTRYTRHLLISLPNITINEYRNHIKVKGKEYDLTVFKSYIEDKKCNVYELTEQDYLLISMISI